MNPNEYQKLASRTRCPQDLALSRLSYMAGDKGAQLLHATLGIAGESGELAGAIEKYAYYQQGMDYTNVVEELGDLLWYVAEACDALGVSLGYVMEANIRKLQERYPEKFSTTQAMEENRDRVAEARALDDGPAYE